MVSLSKALGSGNIRPLVIGDVPRVVDIHLQSFPGFFLASLGAPFLRCFYEGVCKTINAISYVNIDQDGVIQGFVVGVANPKGFYSELLKNDWLKFALASIGPLFRRPGIAVRLLRALRHPSKNPSGDDVAGLLSIAVAPNSQAGGCGKALIQCFLAAASERGCRSVVLTTDADDNFLVNEFYRKSGFMLRSQYFTPEARRMNEYIISLDGV